MLKIKCGCKLELQTLETINLFGSTNKLIDKTKNGENVPSLERVEKFLVPCNLVRNQCHQKYEVLSTFITNKYYAYLLNVELSNLLILKTYNTDSHVIIITFRDQNGRLLEKEDKISLTLHIKK